MTFSCIEKYHCHSLNIQICNAFLKRHLLKGIKYTIQQLVHTIIFTHLYCEHSSMCVCVCVGLSKGGRQIIDKYEIS